MNELCKSAATLESKEKPKRVEGSVWTEAMLAVLEKGIEGGKWFSLRDKAISEKALRIAYSEVRKNQGAPGSDNQTIKMFEKNLDKEIAQLQLELKENRYTPRAVRRVQIPKPGSVQTRPLGIPAVRDRVVQGALRNAIEPIFEHEFVTTSYGFRPNRGAKDALREVDKLLNNKHRYIVEVDIEKFFDTISHEKLMKIVKEKIADNQILNLIEKFLKAKVKDGDEIKKATRGTPQGGVISPMLANIYLHPFDTKMVKHSIKAIRYADDIVIPCKTREEAEQAYKFLQEEMQALELTLHPEKTKIVDMNQPGNSFEFLGYRFVHLKNKPGKIKRYPRAKSLQKFRDKVRSLTRRLTPAPMTEIIGRLNQVLRGYFEYFKHSSSGGLTSSDQFTRQRIRSILRRRNKKKGIEKGGGHSKWNNQFFNLSLKLFNMDANHKLQRC